LIRLNGTINTFTIASKYIVYLEHKRTPHCAIEKWIGPLYFLVSLPAEYTSMYNRNTLAVTLGAWENVLFSMDLLWDHYYVRDKSKRLISRQNIKTNFERLRLKCGRKKNVISINHVDLFTFIKYLWNIK